MLFKVPDCPALPSVAQRAPHSRKHQCMALPISLNWLPPVNVRDKNNAGSTIDGPSGTKTRSHMSW